MQKITGPGALIIGGVVLSVIGFFLGSRLFTLFGILMIVGGAGLSLYWAGILRR